MKDYLDEYIVVTRLLHRDSGATIYELAEALGKTTRAVYIILNQLENSQSGLTRIRTTAKSSDTTLLQHS